MIQTPKEKNCGAFIKLIALNKNIDIFNLLVENYI